MTNAKAIGMIIKDYTSTEASKTKCHNGLWSSSQKRLFSRCCHRITNCAEIRTHFLRQQFRNFLALLSRPCFSPVGNSLRAAWQQYPTIFLPRNAYASTHSAVYPICYGPGLVCPLILKVISPTVATRCGVHLRGGLSLWLVSWCGTRCRTT